MWREVHLPNVKCVNVPFASQKPGADLAIVPTHVGKKDTEKGSFVSEKSISKWHETL
jgi:hypothetical protein